MWAHVAVVQTTTQKSKSTVVHANASSPASTRPPQTVRHPRFREQDSAADRGQSVQALQRRPPQKAVRLAWFAPAEVAWRPVVLRGVATASPDVETASHVGVVAVSTARLAALVFHESRRRMRRRNAAQVSSVSKQIAHCRGRWVASTTIQSAPQPLFSPHVRRGFDLQRSMA